jgi:D-erythrulose 1-phosphate 3-epimerase
MSTIGMSTIGMSTIGVSTEMRARLGINNCFAVKRWPRPADWAAVIRDELGLDVVELSLDLVGDITASGERQCAAEQILAALSQYGLQAETVFTGLAAYSRNLLMDPDPEQRRAAREWYLAVIDLAAALGARGAGGHVGAMSVPDWSDPLGRAERWSGLQEGLAELTRHAREAGLDYLLVENLAAGREPSTIAGLETLLTDGDTEHVPVRLCLDVGHQCVPGTSGPDRDPYAWLQHFGSSLAEVQLQQSDGVGDRHWPFTSERNGVGRIDPGRVLDTLADSGAGDVLLMLEVIPAFEQDDAEVIADLRASAEYWQRALAERGL